MYKVAQQIAFIAAIGGIGSTRLLDDGAKVACFACLFLIGSVLLDIRGLLMDPEKAKKELQ